MNGIDHIAVHDLCKEINCKYYPDECCSICSIIMDYLAFRKPKTKEFWADK